jgi:hypothetical protein
MRVSEYEVLSIAREQLEEAVYEEEDIDEFEDVTEDWYGVDGI